MINLPTFPTVRPRAARAAALTLAAAMFASNAGPLLAAARGDRPWTVADEITVDEIKSDLTWLSDDARQGRGILTPGLDEAAAFIADRFKTLGLKPIDGLDGYYHNFDLPFGSELIAEKTSLVAEGGKNLALGKDYTPLAWSTPAEFAGELAFAGYGISSERYGYDDFAGADVQGKVLLVMRNEPRGKDGKSAFTKSDRNSRDGSTTAKARAAERAGAAAVILVDQPVAAKGEGDGEGAADKLMEFGRGSKRAGIPVYHVTRGVANQWLRQAGLPNLRKLQQDIDAKLEPATQGGKKPVTITGGFAAEAKNYPLKNVAGMVEGKRADEFIVIGAHYDHVGMGDYGSSYGRAIHNGADDNGSGTTALLALAEAFAKSPDKPERSIVFVAFTAEEIGLVGSEKFVAAEPIPMSQVAAMVNLDMVGRVREGKLYVGGWNAAPAFPEILTKADAASPLELTDMGGDMANRSDHFNFVQKGIAAVFFFSGLHEEYHSPKDDAPLINYKGMEAAAELAYGVIRDIDATPREQLAAEEPAAREMLDPTTRPATRPSGGDQAGGGGEGGGASGERRARLGVMPDFAGEGVAGVKVGGVSDDSPAAKAGLRTGDVIIKIGDVDITSLEELQQVLVSSEPGTKVKVALLRDGERTEVDVVFE